ncbi:kunitz-type protease inhibitor 1b [Salminus brasiliensis]|uniref:kunitz-type protease inhibitor 1b n=1 Tax=Salminus brasiliensis TaxID=930266 RepID=UPI003B83934B
MAVFRDGAVGLMLVVAAAAAMTVVGAEVSRQSCSELFKAGREDFAVIAEDSVQEGATYLSNPVARTAEDCMNACCENPRCNLALMERAAEVAEVEEVEEDSLANCFLFDCVYRNKYVCRFVKASGFTNYIRHSVYDEYLGGPPGAHGEEDKRPIANAGPDVVVRPGQPVTLNGIESWDDKKIVSYDWKQLKGNTSVESEKTDLPDQLVLSNLQPGVYKFQLTVTDSAHQSDSTSVTVLVLTAEQAERHCLTPKKAGPCRGSFPRWHYNAASNKCEEFIFGGCSANGNNYLSEQHCSDACNGTTVTSGARKVKAVVEVCKTPCEDGEFSCSNGCCLDASGECDGNRDCSDGSDENNCQRLNSTLSRLLQIPVNEEKARCVDPPVTGPCRASMARWYYDPLNQICLRFTYGGCSGNKNNFDGKESCMEVCRDVTEKDVFARGVFERSEQEEHHSGSVATAVILAVVILALLSLLGFCFLKKRKSRSQRQRVPTANPAVTLTEDTEHLVYKPTTTTSS